MELGIEILDEGEGHMFFLKLGSKSNLFLFFQLEIFYHNNVMSLIHCFENISKRIE